MIGRDIKRCFAVAATAAVEREALQCGFLHLFTLERGAQTQG